VGGLSQSLTISYAGRNTTTYGPLTIAPNSAGDYTASASFAGDANHNSSNNSRDFSIAKAGQTITFAALPGKTYGDADFTVNATASSGLVVILTPVGQCAVNGLTVSITGAGTCQLTASQSGDTNYSTAANVVQSFAIAKAGSTTSVTGPDVIYEGQPYGGTATVTGAGNLNLVGLALSYTGRNSTNYGPSQNAPTVIGDYTASAIFAGDANHTGSSGSKDFRILPQPSLTGGLAAQTANVNLSTEAAGAGSDWAHWGYGGAPGFNHKANVTQQISNYTVFGDENGTGTPESYGDLAYSHTWTDGTPAPTSTAATTGVRLNRGGFQITAPADTSVRTLKLYVGATYAQGRLQAQLTSDLGPLTFINDSVISSSGTKNFVYTLSYKASSPGQTLTVSYNFEGNLDPDGTGLPSFITLQAATLIMGTPPALPANAAEFVSQTVPTSMISGNSYNVSIKMRNTGASKWTAAQAHYKLGSQNPQDNTTWGITRVAPASNVITGDETTFTFNVTAPQTTSPTTYNFQWQMIKDLDWFGSYTINVPVTVSLPVGGGSLSGSGAALTANVNLTAEGTTDWAHWGLGDTTGFNHKAGVTQQISNFTLLGSSLSAISEPTYAFSWTNDGPPPHTSATTNQYVATNTFAGAGDGFQLTVPADTSTRTLKLYVIATHATGYLTARLSDGSAADYTNTTTAASPSSTKHFVYTINYHAASDDAGQKLTLTYTLHDVIPGSGSQVGLQAATLVGPQPATLTLSGLNQTYDGTPKAATVTTGPVVGLSGVKVTYNGSATLPVNAGSYAVTATLSNPNYVATPVTGTLTIGKADQTITFPQPPDKTFGDADFTANVSASSGLGVSLSAVGKCTAPGGLTVHLTGAGLCTLTASQSGDANYNAAANVTGPFSIAKAGSTTSVTASDATYDGQPHGGSATTTGAGGLSQNAAVSYSGRNGTVYGSTTTAPMNAGDYTASASFAGDADHTSSSGSHDFTIAKASQTITFGTLPGKTYGDADFTVSATASSGLGVSFTAAGPCTVAGSTVHLTGAGSCTITAAQAGAGNYLAAPSVGQPFTVAKATPTITWNNPADIAQGTALSSTQLNATASVPGTFVYTPGAGVVLGAGNGLSLSTSFTPTDSTSYNGTSSTVHINVIACPAVAGSSFTANNSEVAPGASVTLTWDVPNATSVSISGVAGTLTGSGSTTVTPSETTTYTLTANGAGPCSPISLATTVTIASCSSDGAEFTASLTSTMSSDTVILEWQMPSTVSSITITDDKNNDHGTYQISSGSSSGSMNIYIVELPTTYYLTATGNNGCSFTMSATATLSDGLFWNRTEPRKDSARWPDFINRQFPFLDLLLKGATNNNRGESE
jgi:hypothetical protein